VTKKMKKAGEESTTESRERHQQHTIAAWGAVFAASQAVAAVAEAAKLSVMPRDAGNPRRELLLLLSEEAAKASAIQKTLLVATQSSRELTACISRYRNEMLGLAAAEALPAGKQPAEECEQTTSRSKPKDADFWAKFWEQYTPLTKLQFRVNTHREGKVVAYLDGTVGSLTAAILKLPKSIRVDISHDVLVATSSLAAVSINARPTDYRTTTPEERRWLLENVLAAGVTAAKLQLRTRGKFVFRTRVRPDGKWREQVGSAHEMLWVLSRTSVDIDFSDGGVQAWEGSNVGHPRSLNSEELQALQLDLECNGTQPDRFMTETAGRR